MIRDVIVAVVAALVVNELTDLSRWTAVRVTRWAAGKIHADNPDRAARRAEDWEALISGESIPTKISKLFSGWAWVALGSGACSSARSRRSSPPWGARSGAQPGGPTCA
jgi:hypothetical protein